MSIRIMLVDDHLILREALRGTLNAEPGLMVVAEAGTGREALECLKKDCPDILLLDIGLPDMTGIDVAIQALVDHPKLIVVALSGYVDKVFIDEMLKAGGRAYVSKSAGTQGLIAAIRAVVAGHVYLSPEITGAMVDRGSCHVPGSAPPLSILGRRERDVLKLLAKGLRSSAIGAELGIQPATVDVHRNNIKNKLGLRTVAELTRYAIREGLLSS
ncbi:response regulator transcription factor [Azoarcus sp. L1K30]|uniref:response regulator n=1 Tax=Azoarcus sp. L1K30 TaxID=2820277 RepID=UPI001B8461DC|nr:response regulator transcription factor [Azoarcus sp. L1K30]MBR0565148.1 response regulator transcription factor [Azoarcus sp. L1K30]